MICDFRHIACSAAGPYQQPQTEELLALQCQIKQSASYFPISTAKLCAVTSRNTFHILPENLDPAICAVMAEEA
jgi:hypothetical protein